MYPLCFNALRVLHWVLMGALRRRVRRRPSNRHGHAVSEAAVAGTRAQTSRSRHERPRKVPVGPPTPRWTLRPCLVDNLKVNIEPLGSENSVPPYKLIHYTYRVCAMSHEMV